MRCFNSTAQNGGDGSQAVKTPSAAFPALFPRDFRTLFPRFAETDRDRLLSTFHFATRTAFQSAPLFAMHGRLHTLTRRFTVLRHGPCCVQILCWTMNCVEGGVIPCHSRVRRNVASSPSYSLKERFPTRRLKSGIARPAARSCPNASDHGGELVRKPGKQEDGDLHGADWPHDRADASSPQPKRARLLLPSSTSWATATIWR